MGVAAVVMGVIGLMAVALGLPLMRPELFFGGGSLSIAAFVLGFIGREAGKPAKAGMALGLLGTIACSGLFFLLTSRSAPDAGSRAIEVPAVIKAAEPIKDPAKDPAKIVAQPPS